MTIFKLLFLSTLVGTASCACFDNGDKEIGGSCYKFVAQKLTFEDARNWCHYQNPVTSSYLAYVPNQFTSNFLASYARSAFASDDGSFWIGLSRKTGGAWTWDSGNPLGYTNFGGQLGNNYVAESIINAKWNTFGNNDKNYFVCGYDPAAPPTFQPLSPTPSGATAIMGSTTSPVPTTTASKCTPKSESTFFFAYSNDVDVEDVTKMFDYVSAHLYLDTVFYTTYANIRFDVKNEEDIQYHHDFPSLQSSIYSHLPDSSIGYGDNRGSDVFNVIQKFLSSSDQSELCGSAIYIMVKRFPNDTNLTNLIDCLRQNHIFVYVIAEYPSTGGTNSHSLFEIASKTNGFCFFLKDLSDSVKWTMDFIIHPYQFLAQKYVVSGKGRIDVPIFRTPDRINRHIFDYSLYLTFKDNVPDGSFISLNYTIASLDGQDYYTSDNALFYGTGMSSEPYMRGSTDYKWTIDYQYSNNEDQVIEISLYSIYYNDFMPFHD